MIRESSGIPTGIRSFLKKVFGERRKSGEKKKQTDEFILRSGRRADGVVRCVSIWTGNIYIVLQMEWLFCESDFRRPGKLYIHFFGCKTLDGL